MQFRCPAGLLLLLCSSLVQAVAGEATLREEAGEVVFGNEHLVLRFDSASGIWTGLETGSSTGLFRRTAAQPSVNLTVAGKPVFAVGVPVVQRQHEVVRLAAASRLDMVLSQGDWEVTVGYALWDAGTLQRTVTYAYLGTESGGEVRNATLVLPPLAVPGEDAFWFATAEYPTRDHPFRHTDPGRRFSFPFADAILGGLIARDEASGLNLVAAYYSEEERVKFVAEEQANKVLGEYVQQVAETLRPGLRFTVGSQLLRVVSGSRLDALRALQGFYDLPGLRTRIGMPADTGRNIFYSAHPRGTIDSSHRDVGGFANFTKLLPSIRDLGVNTLWLMPFWYGPVYAPYEYYKLDPKCGTPEDLRALTTEAHRLDMRVLGDLIPHGPREEPGAKPTFGETHPDWVCRDQQGNMVQWWGCHYCDYANPGWQDYMADHAAYWVRECGLDGYRVDVAAGGAPNWRPYDGNRPSFSGLKGGLELLRKARAACLKENPKTLFLAESHGPALYSATEHEYHWAFARLLADHVLLDDPAVFVQAMSGYLENQTYAFPADAFPIRYLTNHDELRARYLYGPGLHRALLALCAFMKGAPLLYQEEEIGNEDFLAQLYGIRQRYDELCVGDISYRSIKATPAHVFTIEREYQGKHSVVAINLTGQTTPTTLSLPKSDLAQPGIYEAVSGQQLPYASELAYTLPAYGYAVFVVREKGELPPTVPPVPRAVASPRGTVEVVREGETVTIAGPLYTAVVDGAQGGLLREMRGGDSQALLRGMVLREGQRKLFVGCDPLDLAQTHATLAIQDKEIVATGELRDAEGVSRLAYRLRYLAEATGLDCEVDLTPLTDLPITKSELNLQLRFVPTSHWFAQTSEGDLWGHCLRRHPADHGFGGRYWHEAGQTFHDSSLYPTPPGGEIGVADAQRGLAVGVECPPGDGFGSHLLLLEDKGADSPAELGGPAAATAELQLLDRDAPTVWQTGQAKRAHFRLVVRNAGTPPSRDAIDAYCQKTVAQWQTYGPVYRLTGANVRAEAIRSRGGALCRLTDAAGHGLPITDARFYTDRGLFEEWKDSRGVTHNMNATNREDPEPDTQLLAAWQDAQTPIELRFRSFFRHPYAGGRSLLSPRMEYAVSYTVAPAGDGVRIDCRTRPQLVKLDTAAFLAYKISLGKADEWQVDGGEWQALPAEAGRVWESKVVGHLPSTIALRNRQTGDWTRFGDFAIAAGQVQNLFLHAGQGQAHLFVAFYDQEPTDVRQLWRQAAFTMQAGGQQ